MTLQRAEIAACAYALWELRGKPVGSPEVDWYEAEKQLGGDDESASDTKEKDGKKTEATPRDAPVPKPRRPVRKTARQNRANGAARD